MDNVSKLISNKEAMEILGLKHKNSMSRFAKKNNIKKVKEWKEVFYYEDEILRLKKQKDPNYHKKAMPCINKTPLEKTQSLDEIRNIFKSSGLFLQVDNELLLAYVKDISLLNQIRQGLKDNGISLVDDNGKESLSADFLGYLKLAELQLKREKALGIGAGNRKGLEVSTPTEITEMEELID